jgi:hypothetical protein
MTPLFCFSMTARFRGTAHFPRHVLRPDVSGSAEMAQMGGQDDRFIIATIGDRKLFRCAKPFRSVVEKLSPLLARKLEIEVLQRAQPAHGETKLRG